METFGNDLLHGLSEISATDKSVVIQDNTKDNGLPRSLQQDPKENHDNQPTEATSHMFSGKDASFPDSGNVPASFSEVESVDADELSRGTNVDDGCDGSDSNSRDGRPAGDTTYRKLFVGGLAWQTTTETLQNHFHVYGELQEAVVICDKTTGRSKGYGFVTYKRDEDAQRAVANKSPIIDGRKTNCNLAALGVKKEGKRGKRNHNGHGMGQERAMGYPNPMMPNDMNMQMMYPMYLRDGGYPVPPSFVAPAGQAGYPGMQGYYFPPNFAYPMMMPGHFPAQGWNGNPNMQGGNVPRNQPAPGTIVFPGMMYPNNDMMFNMSQQPPSAPEAQPPGATINELSEEQE
mmetsp:Transcript_42781/g.134833  ORF Transcript_42781/g.134833 Transcript_42781/m.134833 type:complete len:346 (-) Transcript_42781:86-1123(-)